MRRLVLSLLSFLALSCASARNGPWLQWETEDAGFDAPALSATRLYADEARSAAVMAVYDGRVLAAWGDVGRKLELHSVRKSLYAALWGIAEARGLVSLESTLAELEIDDLEPLTSEEKKARIIDLLQARSGVYHPAAYASSDQEEGLPKRGSHPPGTFWYYNNWDFNVAGALLERIAGKPLGSLFQEWIAAPIGMEDYEAGDAFDVLEPGRSKWPAVTFRMSTRDLARFGQLWLDRGVWNGRQIIPASWVERASAPVSAAGSAGGGYGMMWWTYAAGSIPSDRYPEGSRHAFVQSRGTGGQAVFVIPDAKMVVVHRGDTDHSRNVGGVTVWTIVDRILAAKTKEPVAHPRFVALRPEPFASQLPAMTWADPLSLEREVATSLTGSYEFAPGTVGRVFLHQGRLFASMPGEGEAELLARSASEFFMRVDPTVTVRFAKGEQGAPDSVIVSLGGRELTGRRVPD